MDHYTVSIPEEFESGSNTSGRPASSPKEKKATPGSVRKWYFMNNEGSVFRKNSWLIDGSSYTFLCTESDKRRVSVRANASKRFTSWHFDMGGWDRGLYDVVLGVSVVNLCIERIESVTFNISTGVKDFGPSEIISHQSLVKMTSTHGAGILRWKLHQQLEKRDAVGPKVIVMEIRPAQGMASDCDLGFLKLHHMELWAAGGSKDAFFSDADPSLRIH
ncbi:unnamed protein product [Mortierella alpina]